jgi:hypothetical protein
MSEKLLSESAWKSWLSKQEVDDPGIQKALAAYTKAGDDAGRAAGALETVIALVAKLRKSVGKDKKVTEYLDELAKAALKRKSVLETEAKAGVGGEESEEEEGEEDEEEKGNPAEVLAKALRKVKTAGGDSSHAAMICLAKPLLGLTVGLNAKKKLGQKHKAALKESTGGTRVLEGRCVWENNAFTFILETVAGGLAKRLKSTLVKQTGLTQKVRVRNLDGSMVLDDETDVDSEGGDELGAFKSRVAELKPAATKAIESKSPRAEEIRKALTEAVKQAEKKNFDLANKLLDAVAKLTGTPSTDSDGPAPLDQRNDTPVSPPPPPVTGNTPPRLQNTPPPPPPQQTPPPPPQSEFDRTEIEPVRKLLVTLTKHVQQAHAARDIASATDKIQEAEREARANQLPKARTALGAARLAITVGTDAANKFDAFTKKRAQAADLVKAMEGMYASDTKYQSYATKLTEADNLVLPDQRKFTEANAKLDVVLTEMPNTLKNWYVTGAKTDLANLKKHAAATFLEPLTKDLEKLIGETEKAFNAKNYRAVTLSSNLQSSKLQDAKKAGDRRVAYDIARKNAVTELDRIRKFKGLAKAIEDLDKRLKAADEMASLTAWRFEAATAEAGAIQKEVTRLFSLGPTQETFVRERAEAEKTWQQRSKHAQAKTIAEALGRARELLSRADTLAADLATLAQARESVGRARLDLANLEAVLKQAEGTASALAGTGAKDGVKKAVAALRKQAETLGKHPQAAAVKDELKQITEHLDAADKHLGKKKNSEAEKSVKAAGALLSSLGETQLLIASSAAQADQLEKRLGTVEKLPQAKALKDKIKPVRDALTAAAKALKDSQWKEQVKQLGLADEALRALEQAAKDQAAFESLQDEVAKRLKNDNPGNPLKGLVEKDLKEAEQKATAFDYAAATKALQRADNRLEAAVIEAKAKQTPPDKNAILASAKKMMAKGGGKELDAAIEKLPDTVPFEVLPILAKERFGIELKSDAGDETKSGKRMLKMLAMVPEDVVGNVSLKTVERREPNKNGGFYRSSEDLVVMNGRPGQSTQGFGPAISDELPTDVESDCKPKDNAGVDYFDFATLHEVGHAVDDNLNFMGSRMGKAEFGGWESFGGNVAPIAAKVAKWAGYDSTPEQKKAVEDLVLGKSVTWPKAPSGQETAWATAQKKVTDWYAIVTNGQIWWRQGECDKVTIDGMIYHEAYKRTWVGYLASARKQAITGYQFRAPGEWFAELYASYRIGKLKDTHPAVKWLSKIKI